MNSIVFLFFLDFHFLTTPIFPFAVLFTLLVLVTFTTGRRSANHNEVVFIEYKQDQSLMTSHANFRDLPETD